MDPNFFKSRFPGDLANQFPEHPKACSPQIQSLSFGGSFHPITKYFNLNYFIVTTAKMATNHHFTHETLYVHKQWI